MEKEDQQETLSVESPFFTRKRKRTMCPARRASPLLTLLLLPFLLLLLPRASSPAPPPASQSVPFSSNSSLLQFQFPRIRGPFLGLPSEPRSRRDRSFHFLRQAPQVQVISSPSSASLEPSKRANQTAKSSQESLLQTIDEITRGLRCVDYHHKETNPGTPLVSARPLSDPHHIFLDDVLHSRVTRDPEFELPSRPVQLHFKATSNRIDLLSSILSDYNPDSDGFKLLRKSLDELVRLDESLFRVRIAWLEPGSDPAVVNRLQAEYYVFLERRKRLLTESYNKSIPIERPWLRVTRKGRKNQYLDKLVREGSVVLSPNTFQREDLRFAEWTPAYYSCEIRKWLFSYTAFVVSEVSATDLFSLKAVISVDVDITKIDLNQCDNAGHEEPDLLQDWHQEDDHSDLVIPLPSTHKCHRESSRCIFWKGSGWRRGGYICRCRDGYYSPVNSVNGQPHRQHFNGSLVETAWDEKVGMKGLTYDVMYTCKKCAEGCITCGDGAPCLSSYNWAFRISLLIISILCIFFTLVLICYIYKYRKLKVFKVASPIFLYITLIGCAIMYSEMASIFPVLDMWSCVVTKWTRHMGFCITYSALLLKTWRVSLTYRVKSAHKLKLTDKQLLQWLFPILLVMGIYLSTWSISSPPFAVYIKDWKGLRFRICDYNWWDHSLVIGESLFLLWGIKVCYNVRNAESFFNEAKYITWAIYNIAVTNILMIFIHILILPNAGPDVKYLFGFLRTQFSTTTTVILIFGPKFYRVLKGQGDSWDNRVRARGVNASFSLNGVGLVHEEQTDLYQENEELKEEIHKLATQIELMKLMHMEINNRHLKAKHGTGAGAVGLLSGHGQVTITTNPASGATLGGHSSQSPIVKAIYSRFDTNESPSPRISPAAELVSERV